MASCYWRARRPEEQDHAVLGTARNQAADREGSTDKIGLKHDAFTQHRIMLSSYYFLMLFCEKPVLTFSQPARILR